MLGQTVPKQRANIPRKELATSRLNLVKCRWHGRCRSVDSRNTGPTSQASSVDLMARPLLQDFEMEVCLKEFILFRVCHFKACAAEPYESRALAGENGFPARGPQTFI